MLAKAISTQQLLAGESNLYVATPLLKLTYQLTAGIACMEGTPCSVCRAQYHNISLAVDLPECNLIVTYICMDCVITMWRQANSKAQDW